MSADGGPLEGAMDVTSLPELEDEEEEDTEQEILLYLYRTWRGAVQLTHIVPPNEANVVNFATLHPPDGESLGHHSGDWFIQDIARTLIRACHFPLLSSIPSTAGLPPPVYHQSKHDVMDEVEDDPVPKMDPYPLRRIDYLRHLLRAMAPVSFDVAAQVGQALVTAPTVTVTTGESQVDDSTRVISQATRRAAFLLFSVWLPVAPHIASVVTELFELKSFTCPVPTKAEAAQEQLQESEVWLLIEAAHYILRFYGERQHFRTAAMWWDWTPIFTYLDDADQRIIDPSTRTQSGITVFKLTEEEAIFWHAVRAASWVLNLSPGSKGRYYQRYQVPQQQVPWLMHPWALDDEEFLAQSLYVHRQAPSWREDEPLPCPRAHAIRKVVTLHPYLLEVSPGFVFAKIGALSSDTAALAATTPNRTSTTSSSSWRRLIRTATTRENFSLIARALCIESNPPPILICGPHGSGKSSLVRELARMFHSVAHPSSRQQMDPLLEIHVDEETDTKTLVGSYTATDIPGEFEWRPGALTQAVRSGQWVLMEDMDSVPMEIQASLVRLFEERVLPVGPDKTEICHPNFRLFGTLSVGLSPHDRKAGGKQILSPELWRRVDVKPLPVTELREIAIALHPGLPELVVNSALSMFQAIDQSGRADEAQKLVESASRFRKLWLGRTPSVRDLLKLLSRISNGIRFEENAGFVTESQRTLCLGEAVDVFAAACPDRATCAEFIRSIAAPVWNITADLAMRYVETRAPTVVLRENCTEIGRALITVSHTQAAKREELSSFAQTPHSLRMMESICVCIRENEPVLLVGETGCGKTTILQYLAKMLGRHLVVQNLSLQTDSTDLLGGYRPIELGHIARRLYYDFVDLFTSTFSRKQNADFLAYASSCLKKGLWKKLSQCFNRAAKMGLGKLAERSRQGSLDDLAFDSWKKFSDTAERFEKQRVASESGFAFVFTEGALVDAIEQGSWVLLDEINLASSETLQRLSGLLDDFGGSLTITERGDATAIRRHPEFRIFAAMNPATDSGKKDLSQNIRSRFTEIFVDEVSDSAELRLIASRYLSGVVSGGTSIEETNTLVTLVDLYKQCRTLADGSLVDGNGQKPRYTLRTLARALTAARELAIGQKLSLQRALLEGFELAFLGPLANESMSVLSMLLTNVFGGKLARSELDHPGRRPRSEPIHVLIKPFWIKAGEKQPIDFSNEADGAAKFILTPSTSANLRRLARAVAAGPWPILLEGPTSSGKTSLVEYLAARCGHVVVRINNHEHTEIQEYTGGFAADSNGSLSFQDGLLVRAVKKGHWVILDELNLAPTEVLEALNRLLDDNRELYIPEINQTVRPHPSFRLFATQNPCGAYGGRKPLSRAFRNRFVEMHVGEIPSQEMVTILEKKSGCHSSHAKALVKVMDALRCRRSKSEVFLGRDGFVTPRDLLRWAARGASSKHDLAREGYMLLAERLRRQEEKDFVKDEIERSLNVQLDMEEFYFGDSSEARRVLVDIGNPNRRVLSGTVAPTKSILRMLTLVIHCAKQREPVLLVGDTGCGKTMAVQLVSELFKRTLHIVNCHATTETSDLLGGLRPVRGRSAILESIIEQAKELLHRWPNPVDMPDALVSSLVNPSHGTADLAASIAKFVRELWESRACGCETRRDQERDTKRRKTGTLEVNELKSRCCCYDDLYPIVQRLERLSARYNSLFEWSDGPLVQAMQHGDMILLDEMSLAEDAVLERLNSVLEPSRILVLAEDFSSRESNSHEIVAKESFMLFGTMNPGGDYGKRELSPALRSRFTEIWVPPISDYSDIDLILQRTLGALDSCIECRVRKQMLEYIKWFNTEVCSDQTNPCAELTLSLRDVTTWSDFVVTMTRNSTRLSIWDAYVHGARLMHLDGLGLGTGMAPRTTDNVRRLAEVFLSRQTEEEGVMDAATDCLHFGISDGQFGSKSFAIPLGSFSPRAPSFTFDASTTAQNLSRTLRAMQMSKPLLLEGAPGVGKTTLIMALAEASGHRLIRINLSEQTDMSDLVGSDLPLPLDDDDKTPTGPEVNFQWRDGVLLSAIKNGDWVLLDELNLASQSVLEGLNSCLDHRASVYIPELGRSFNCPPSFRVFAAQNPLSQGGARKGLPKSFLNRFTKVFVEGLCADDLRAIVGSKYVTISEDFISRLLDLNTTVHRDVNELKIFGHNGSPWDFNLRDVFRVCELFASEDNEHVSPEMLRHFIRDIYSLRFRSFVDRKEVDLTLAKIFRESSYDIVMPRLQVKNSALSLGDVLIELFDGIGNEIADVTGNDPQPQFSMHEPMAAVARCIRNNWPCLLVGGPEKMSAVRTLSDVLDIKVVEVALSSSSDVSELIGGFEQVDGHDRQRSLLELLLQTSTRMLRSTPGKVSSVASLLYWLRKCLFQPFDAEVTKSAVALAVKLSEKAAERGELDLLVEHLREILRSSEPSGGAGRFQWKDGPLIEAMTKGYWLHIRNANLCPASVLDRLNSVLEPGGSLLLSECTSGDGSEDSSVRRVSSHPLFRIFLSINPQFGEVSRAMRNRCVEVAFLGSECPLIQAIDTSDDIWRAGARSTELCRLSADCDLRARCGSVAVLVATMKRGILPFRKTRTMSESQLLRRCHGLVSFVRSPLMPVELVRAGWAITPGYAHLGNDARGLRTFSALEGASPEIAPYSALFEVTKACSRNFSWLGQHNWELIDYFFTRDELMLLFLQHGRGDLEDRASYFDRLNCSIPKTMRFVATYIFRALRSDKGNSLKMVLEEHVLQRLRERRWLDQINHPNQDTSPGFSVLAASFFIATGKYFKRPVECLLTPALYPFFVQFDQWAENSLFKSALSLTEERISKIGQMLSNRDDLWNICSDLAFREKATSKLYFEPFELMVKWKELRGMLVTYESEMNFSLKAMTRVIDAAVVGGGSCNTAGSILAETAKPIVPRTAKEWNGLLALRDISDSLTSWRDVCAPNRIGFDELIEQRHPILVVGDELRNELLASLCMFHLSATKEVNCESVFSSAFRRQSDELIAMFTANLKSVVDKLSEDLQRIQINPRKDTVEILLDEGELEHVSTSSGTFHKDFSCITDSLLIRWASLQVAPCADFWCEGEELQIHRVLCQILLESPLSPLTNAPRNQGLLTRLRRFLNVAMTSGFRETTALRPYQTLIWALERVDTDKDDEGLLASLLSMSALNLARRTWSNSYDMLLSMELDIDFPVIVERGSLSPRRLDHQTESCNSQLGQFVPILLLLKLIGEEYRLIPGQKACTWLNLATSSARRHQSAKLLSTLSLFAPNTTSSAWEINFWLSDTIRGLASTFPPVEGEILLAHSRDVNRLLLSSDQDIRNLAAKTRNGRLLEMIETVLVPLFRELRELWLHQSNTALGKSKLLLGLLRYHLLLPDVPVDPGKEARSKCLVLDRQLRDAGIRAGALQLDAFLRYGDTLRSVMASEAVMGKGVGLDEERQIQMEKVIERLNEAPPFEEFFLEVQDFSSSHFQTHAVLSLLQENPYHSEEGTKKLDHWLKTTESFAKRLLIHFSSFEDVVVPIVVAIGFARDGLRIAMNSSKPSRPLDGRLMSDSCRFPFVDLQSDPSVSLHTIAENISTARPTPTKKALCTAGLCHVVFRTRLFNRDAFTIRQWFQFADGMFPIGSDFTLGSCEKPLSGDDHTDSELRKQFPDHRAAFEGLTTEEESDEMVTTDIEASSVPAEDVCDIQVEMNYVEQIAFLHSFMFSSSPIQLEDFDRMHAFHLSYGAIASAAKTLGTTFESLPQPGLSGFALSICRCIPSNGPGFSKFRNPFATELDFQRDPNPAEAMKAAGPLSCLVARVAQLLSVFPGNAILLALARVAEKVRKMDLMSASIAKLMTGLEVLLKNAQEWEQHASKRVKLGDPLTMLSRLVTDWRRLELLSWRRLIRSREEDHERRARSHWPTLHIVLSKGVEQWNDGTQKGNHGLYSAPSWVWRGIPVQPTKNAPNGDSLNDDQPRLDLIKLLDTFCLTAPVGEFSERLRLLGAFSSQLEVECKSFAVASGRVRLYLSLKSLLSFYEQFVPMVNETIERTRRPYVEKLEKETKLARWDEQTYYSLAESNERNHRKLMCILIEYDTEVLQCGVSGLLEQELFRGIRQLGESAEDAATSIPPSSSLFPFELLDRRVPANEKSETAVLAEKRKWTDIDIVWNVSSGLVGKMKQYASKIDSFSKSDLCKASAATGASTADELSQAIFDRIESLRSAKTTRPMKERALVDLFRELKRQGLRTAKNSVPPEIRRLEDLFLLPSPSLYQSETQISSAEKYYLKCISEHKQLRLEVSINGSRYMSGSQLASMLGFSDSLTLLIVQQRCTVSRLVQARKLISDTIKSMPMGMFEAVVGQSNARTRTQKFEHDLRLSIENTKQLRLLLKSCTHLLDGKKLEWGSSTSDMLEEIITGLQDYKSPIGIVTEDDVRMIKGQRDVLIAAKEKITLSGQACRSLECLPADCFFSCASVFEETIASADMCMDLSTECVSGEVLSIENLLDEASHVVKSAVLSVQACVKPISQVDNAEAILDLHHSCLREWNEVDIEEIGEKLSNFVDKFMKAFDTEQLGKSQRQCLLGIGSDVACFCATSLEFVDRRFREYLLFYRSVVKLQYVLLRVFRSLVAKGFCTSEDDAVEGDGEGANSGTNFKDGEGTGLGQGEGGNDITDQIESEEQLLGLKGDSKPDGEAAESKQLDKEEAKKGMEMENDFEGDVFDMPSPNEDELDTEEQEQEELEREMGDGASPDERVVDAKLWNEGDDAENEPGEEDKLDLGRPLQEEAQSDEVTTKDEKTDRAEPESNDKLGGETNEPYEDDNEDGGINEDSDDRCEDYKDVEVRDENKVEKSEEDMELDDDLKIESQDEEEENGEDMDMAPSDLVSPGQEPDQNLEESPDEDSLQNQDIEGNQMEGTTADQPDGAEDEKCENRVDAVDDNQDPNTGLGVLADGGKDILQDVGDDVEEGGNGTGPNDNGGMDPNLSQNPASDSATSSGNDTGLTQSIEQGTKNTDHMDVPNPLKSPGDANKYWHRRLNIVESHESEVKQEIDDDQHNENEGEAKGDYEFVGDNQLSSTQALGAIDDHRAVQLREQEKEGDDKEETATTEETTKSGSKEKNMESDRKEKKPTRKAGPKEEIKDRSDTPRDEMDIDEAEQSKERPKETNDIAEIEADVNPNQGSHVVSDLSRLRVEDSPNEILPESAEIVEEEFATSLKNSNIAVAKEKWSVVLGETHNLSRRLCEKMRLVIEPLVASKLRGDYRTGKRINMKRVIGYVASGFRKDKIWLRRTKPAKRNYRVLLAVDDSESMKKSGAGEMALKAMATLAVGMSQLEIGDMGIASFGNEMHLVHPFHLPFTTESGIEVVQHFKFDQQRTRTALCVESAIKAMDSPGDYASVQLMFMISDGRIERDSRENLRRLVREMVERNILLAMIIVEGREKKDSIMNMKEVTFKDGKPTVKPFMENYPFPYYIVLDDMHTLPEILGDALRQWFEMLAQLQEGAR